PVSWAKLLQGSTRCCCYLRLGPTESGRGRTEAGCFPRRCQPVRSTSWRAAGFDAWHSSTAEFLLAEHPAPLDRFRCSLRWPLSVGPGLPGQSCSLLTFRCFSAMPTLVGESWLGPTVSTHAGSLLFYRERSACCCMVII